MGFSISALRQSQDPRRCPEPCEMFHLLPLRVREDSGLGMSTRNLLALATLVALLLPQLRAHAQTPVTLAQPSIKKIMIVMFENEDGEDVIDLPFFSAFAQAGANMTRFFAETHPSQPNYIALTAGRQHGVKTNANHNLDVSHIGDLIEAKGMGWKDLREDIGGALPESGTASMSANIIMISCNSVRTNRALRPISPDDSRPTLRGRFRILALSGPHQ